MAHDRSLYERMGGAPAIEAMLLDFYKRIMADPNLKGFFTHSDVNKLEAMQKEFFTAALDGPLPYSGTPLADAHHGRGIERKHFAAFVNHLLDTLRDIGVEEAEHSAIIARLNTYITDITGSLGSAG